VLIVLTPFHIRPRLFFKKGKTVFNKKLLNITEKILNDINASISYKDACQVASQPENTMDLLACSRKIRERYKKNNIFTCSIINAKSGSCSEDCAFCAQSSRHSTGISVYPLLSREKIVENALKMQQAGATKYSMVTSGFSPTPKNLDILCGAASTIYEKTDLKICASLGVLTEPMARQLKESGITTYHHNLETARSYFGQVCTTHDYDDDIQTVKIASNAGLKVCCGGILGLGESWDMRVELAFTLKELHVDSIPLNFLNPIPGTKMGNRSLLPPMEALKSIAVFRLINPQKDITICGGREVTLGDYQSWVFMAGANGLMIGDYLTTEGRNAGNDIDMIKKSGLEVSLDGV